MATTTSTGIQSIGLVMVPTADQDRSIEFYEKIGFEKRTDTPFGGGYRWIEVYPPSGTTGLALAPPREGEKVEPKEIGVSLTTADADATHSRPALARRGCRRGGHAHGRPRPADVLDPRPGR